MERGRQTALVTKLDLATALVTKLDLITRTTRSKRESDCTCDKARPDHRSYMKQGRVTALVTKLDLITRTT